MFFVQVPKEWHSTITPEMRTLVQNKLKETVAIKRKNLSDEQIDVIYKKLELLDQKLFERAESRSEYYYLVAKETYELLVFDEVFRKNSLYPL